MTQSSPSLQILHRLLLELEEADRQLEQGPRRIRRQQEVVAKREAEIEAARAEVKRLKVLADQKTVQLKATEANIAKLQLALNQASSNREFDALRDQIEADRMANSVLEDEILEMLEQIDAAQEAVEAAIRAKEAAEEEARQLQQRLEADRPALESRRHELQERIAEAEVVIPADLKGEYRRLVNAYRAGALVAVKRGACQNCYTSISPQLRMELKAGKVRLCYSCGRVMYLEDESA